MTPPIEDIVITSENVKELTDEEIAMVQAEAQRRLSVNLTDSSESKTAKKETKETIEKTPELEDENFRIEDTSNWKEITDPNGVKVKENPEGDIREYVEGKYKGEQLFTQDSALRETNKAGKTLPASSTIYRDIIKKKYEGNYQDFLKGENMLFAGLCDHNNKRFYGIDRDFYLRCTDGSFFYGVRNVWGFNGRGSVAAGFSVRCLKD